MCAVCGPYTVDVTPAPSGVTIELQPIHEADNADHEYLASIKRAYREATTVRTTA